MAKVRPSDILFWILATLTLAFLVFFLLVLSGGIPIESPGEEGEAAQTTQTAETTAEPAETALAAEPEEPAPTTTAAAKKPAPKAAQLANVVLTATRGDCWFQARAGSAEGPVLDERVLAQGESISLKSESVWLTVGAAGNLDVTVNGKPQALSSGTVSLVLGVNGAVS